MTTPSESLCELAITIGEHNKMDRALLEPYDSEGVQDHTTHDEEIDENSSNGVVSQTCSASSEEDELSRLIEQDKSTCRYFDNHPPTIYNKRVLNNDYFYQEHYKSCHYSVCEPLPAPHDDLLPEEPPLRAEASISLMTPHLRPVMIREKLLSSRHIRLVKLLPPGHPGDSQRYSESPQSRQLHCEVYQASLDDISSDGQPLFAALSYVCGNPALTRYVWCGQDCIPTTQNLFDALRHVRHDDRPRLLWADGLCIDQKNTEERNHQVGMLHQIYSQAHVISWLGTYNRTDLTAMADYVSLTARIYASVIRSAEAATMDYFNICRAAVAKFEEHFVNEASRSPCRQQMPEMRRIMDAVYFTRVWVAQEIFLGKSVTCQLGCRKFSVAALVASLNLWSIQSGDGQREQLEDITNRYLVPSLVGHWGSLQAKTETQDVAVVVGFGRKQCSDLRDHIYGLSALFETPSAYPIDYSLSVAEVFCDFAVHCFESLNNLSMFWFYRSNMQRKYTAPPDNPSVAFDSFVRSSMIEEVTLPSWCPLWTAESPSIGRTLTSGYTRIRWNAAGDRGLHLDRPSTFAITLEGCVVSKVTWCSTNTVDFRHSAAVLIAEIVEYLLSNPQNTPSTNAVQDFDFAELLSSVLVTLAGNPYLHPENPVFGFFHQGLPHSTQDLLEAHRLEDRVRNFLGPVYLDEAVPELCRSAGLRIDTRIPTNDYEEIALRMERQIFMASGGCCLFVTESGMIGTGLPGTMTGDVVCILFGGSVPYILRPTDIEGQYLLIGECYVEELMEGEAMGMGLREQKFTLV
ncbi:hypothetical protein Q7P36_006404 [Cladosporium allicinum]